MTPQASIGERPPLTLGTKLVYGLGAVAVGAKTQLLGYLLFYYTQIQTLPPLWVGGAIGAANVVDAIWDPSVGQLSDNTRSRLGRRHLYMYISAAPLCLLFYFLWSPPAGLSRVALFAYMATLYIAVRMLISLYELPAAALAPELAPNYDDRTSLISFNWFFRIVSGAVFIGLGSFVFLHPTKQEKFGQLNAAGYAPYALAVAAAMFVSILIATAGTHKFIPYLRQPPSRAITFSGMFREMAATLSNRNFVFLALSGMIFGITVGMGGGLQIFLATYFWGLTSARIGILGLVLIVPSVLAVILAPILAKRMGKKPACLTVFFISIFTTAAPIALRLVGLMPPNGSNLLLLILALDRVVATGLGVMGFIIVTSMIADIVEESELKTGRRSEGLLLSADTLLQKITTGLAAATIPGLILTLVAFPPHARPETLDPTIPTNLVLIYLPITVALQICSTSCLFFYRIDRKQHEDNLEQLAVAAALAEGAEETGLIHP